jgi:urease accessory protein
MTMHGASIHRSGGRWPKEMAADGLPLDFDGRHCRRIRLTTDQGKDVLLELPKAEAMADGDGLQLEDGRWLRVHAAAELIAEGRHKDPNQPDRPNGASVTSGRATDSCRA